VGIAPSTKQIDQNSVLSDPRHSKRYWKWKGNSRIL